MGIWKGITPVVSRHLSPGVRKDYIDAQLMRCAELARQDGSHPIPTRGTSAKLCRESIEFEVRQDRAIDAFYKFIRQIYDDLTRSSVSATGDNPTSEQAVKV